MEKRKESVTFAKCYFFCLGTLIVLDFSCVRNKAKHNSKFKPCCNNCDNCKMLTFWLGTLITLYFLAVKDKAVHDSKFKPLSKFPKHVLMKSVCIKW